MSAKKATVLGTQKLGVGGGGRYLETTAGERNSCFYVNGFQQLHLPSLVSLISFKRHEAFLTRWEEKKRLRPKATAPSRPHGPTGRVSNDKKNQAWAKRSGQKEDNNNKTYTLLQ